VAVHEAFQRLVFPVNPPRSPRAAGGWQTLPPMEVGAWLAFCGAAGSRASRAAEGSQVPGESSLLPLPSCMMVGQALAQPGSRGSRGHRG
jgi:hypothetical protein